MSTKVILKLIQQLYNERIIQSKDNSTILNQDMATFTYSFMLSQYGFKKIADQKFLVFALSIKRNIQIFRINVFAKFLGLLDAVQNFPLEDLNKYIQVLDYVMNVSQVGQLIQNADGDHRFYIPYMRAVQYISFFTDKGMKKEEQLELRKDLERLREDDQIKIDFDIFCMKILDYYHSLLNQTKQYVKNAFSACDLNGNGRCDVNEWFLLIRHIEPQFYKSQPIEKIFTTNADLEVDSEKNLSFEKFAMLCVDYQLFSDTSQSNFLHIDPKGKMEEQVKHQFNLVKQNWLQTKIEIIQRIR